MLKSLFRFHRRNAIQYVYKKGRSVRHGQLSLKFVANNRPESRFGVVVAKKVDKRAVKRNRIRRRIYEVLRKNWDGVSPGVDVLVTVFDKEVAAKPAAELEAEVLGLLKKAQLFKG